MSFIINKKCAYASDAKLIYRNHINSFKNLEYLVVDCLRYNEHPSHFNLSEVLELVDKVMPKKTILTNLHTDMDYKILKKKLPNHILPAYDGLILKL